MKKNIERGVYFLADDRIAELCIAFLNSFRTFNPNLALCFIPYNENHDQIKSLSTHYNFSVFNDPDLLEVFDELSLHFHLYRFGHYRKLAVWQGPFDEFIYIDVDTIVLDDFNFVFDLLDQYDFITATARIPSAVKWVWHDSIYSSGTLTNNQISFAANTGFIASKKGSLSLQEIKLKAAAAKEVARHMNLYCYEQAFINYLIITSGKNYSSLNVLNKTDSTIQIERWAGTKGGRVTKGTIRFDKLESKTLFLHWAGEWQVYEREKKLIRMLQYLRIIPIDKMPLFSFRMPYKKLWCHYRFLNFKKEGHAPHT